MWLVKSCSCSRGFFSGHSPRPVCGRVQQNLKKLRRTTSFGPRQTLLPIMIERESMFWSRSSCTFFYLFIQFMIPSPGGRGVNSHMKRLGLLDILLKFLYQGFRSYLKLVLKTKRDHFQLLKYLLGCTRRNIINKRSYFCLYARVSKVSRVQFTCAGSVRS